MQSSQRVATAIATAINSRSAVLKWPAVVAADDTAAKPFIRSGACLANAPMRSFAAFRASVGGVSVIDDPLGDNGSGGFGVIPMRHMSGAGKDVERDLWRNIERILPVEHRIFASG